MPIMSDELRLFLFPDMATSLIAQPITLQNAVYDCEHGLYPNVKNRILAETPSRIAMEICMFCTLLTTQR